MIQTKKPTKFQLKILSSRAKRRVIRAGRRSGKTVAASLLALEAFGRGRRILYAAPTQEQTQKFWTEVSRTLADRIDAEIYRKNETERCIEVPGTDARIRAKTAWDADTLRGDYADLLILDEAQLMNESAWEYVGAPMLLDNDGDAVFIYTPPSIHDRALSKATDRRWVTRLFERARKDKKRWQAFHCTSHDNPHLSQEALAEIASDMTVLAYKQEILAQDITEIPGALWTAKLLDKTRIAKDALPVLSRIVIGVDPSGSSKTECGIVAAGIDRDGHRYVLRDVSVAAVTPEVWASKAIALYHELRADKIVAERNYGGDMVEAVLRIVDPNVPLTMVQATRGKLVRAEPICAAFERGRAHLVGEFPELEDELCTYVPGNASPNRFDGACWAMAELGDDNGGLGFVEYLRRLAAGLFGGTGEDVGIARAEGLVPRESVADPKSPHRVPGENPARAETSEQVPCPQCGGQMYCLRRSEVTSDWRCPRCGHVWLRSDAATCGVSRSDYFAQGNDRVERGFRSFGRFGGGS
jgi:hypothetical protein